MPRRLTRLFDGETGAYRDIVLLNAGAALMVAGAAPDIKSGVTLAAQALDSGAAKAKLEALIASTERMSILDRILGYKKEEVAAAKSKANWPSWKPAPGMWKRRAVSSPPWTTRKRRANSA